MSDEKALLAAIWEHPHEDTPRLMYADWLEETGKPADGARAEFIRVQCGLAQLDRWDTERRAPLEKREKELWKKWSRQWRSDLPKSQKNCEFSRGFPLFDLSGYEVSELVRLTEVELEGAPLSRYHYDIEGRGILDVLKWPGLRFQQLFSPRPPRLPKGWVKKVALCPALKNVSELCTIDCKLTPADIQMLLDAWQDRHLPILRLACEIGNEGMAVLATHPTAAKVRVLDLRGAKLTVAGIRKLCSSSYLTQIHTLDLWDNPFGNAGLKELLRWRYLSGLRWLNLEQTKITTVGAIALAECSAIGELRELLIGGNHIRADGCRALARSPHLNRLTTLNLYEVPGIEDAAVQKELRQRFKKAVDW